MTMAMMNVLTDDDFEDDDCLEESLADIKSLVATYAPVVDIKADKINGGIVLIEIDANASLAQSIVQQLNGTRIGGQEVSLSLQGSEMDRQ